MLIYVSNCKDWTTIVIGIAIAEHEYLKNDQLILTISLNCFMIFVDGVQ